MFLLTVEWFQLFFSNTNNFQINLFDPYLPGTTTPSQSRSWSCVNEIVTLYSSNLQNWNFTIKCSLVSLLHIELWRGGGCSSWANNVIAGRTSVNRWNWVTWVTTGIRGRCEIIYTRSTVGTVSLTGDSLQSGVLDLDTVNYGDWPQRRSVEQRLAMAASRETEKAKM